MSRYNQADDYQLDASTSNRGSYSRRFSDTRSPNPYEANRIPALEDDSYKLEPKGGSSYDGRQDYDGRHDYDGQQDYNGRHDYDRRHDYDGRHDYEQHQSHSSRLYEQSYDRPKTSFTPSSIISDLTSGLLGGKDSGQDVRSEGYIQPEPEEAQEPEGVSVAEYVQSFLQQSNIGIPGLDANDDTEGEDRYLYGETKQKPQEPSVSTSIADVLQNLLQGAKKREKVENEWGREEEEEQRRVRERDERDERERREREEKRRMKRENEEREREQRRREDEKRERLYKQ